MRWPPRELSEHEFQLAQRGMSPADLARLTGLSEAGVRRLLRANALPINEVVRKRYVRLLQLMTPPTLSPPPGSQP